MHSNQHSENALLGRWPTRIRLAVRQQGHVPAFKNKKRAIQDKRTGKMRTLTEPKVAEWMEQCIQSLESQLFLALATAAEGTLMGRSRQSWIASSLPLDDSRQWIPEQHIYCKDVTKGEEGAEIIIERIA